MVRVSVTGAAGSKQNGIPYSYYSKPSTLSTFVRNQEIPCTHSSTLPTAQIVNETSEFSTRAFVIKYRDERLDLNEGCQFQLLLETEAVEQNQEDETPSVRTREAVTESSEQEDQEIDDDSVPKTRHKLIFEYGEPIQLKLELLMAELEKPSEEQSSSVAAEKPSTSPVFTRIASQTLSVVCDPASQQLHAYYPVTFSAMHFCQLDMTVHTCLINLKFRKRAYSRPEGNLDSSREASKKKSGESSQILQARRANSATLRDVRHFHQLLFPDTDRDAPLDGDDARSVHHAYLQPMLQSLGATAAALRTMCASSGGELNTEAEDVPSSRAVAGVMALIKRPYVNGSPFGLQNAAATTSTENTDRNTDDTTTQEESTELTPARVATCVEADVKLVARRLFLLWGRFVAMLPQDQFQPSGAPTVVGRLQRAWLTAQRRWWASRLRNHSVKVQKILQPTEPDELDAVFKELRSSEANSPKGPASFLPIYDANMLKSPELLPVCTSHLYVRRDQTVPPGDNNLISPPAERSSSPTDFFSGGRTSAVNSMKSFGGSSLSLGSLNPSTPESTLSTSSLHAGFPPQGPPVAPGVPCLEDAPDPTKPPNSPRSGRAPSSQYRGPHLIVMQHGWYASSFDMRLLRAYALLLFPRAVVLSPQSNEDNTGGSIGPMGQRLAHEIHNFIKHRCPELCDTDPSLGRISFIGHSAGSMIVRTALTSQVFKPYLPKLHAFISLSSSHCGNMFVQSTVISGGMWALQHLHNSAFMNELQLIDHSDMTQSFIYKLSQAPGFELFRYVILVGSQQDSYVPMHTAQVTIPRPAELSKKDGNVYVQMAANLMKPLKKSPDDPKQTTVVRMTIDHKFTQTTSLDVVIGRAAHLAYIDSSPAVLLVLFSLYNLLK